MASVESPPSEETAAAEEAPPSALVAGKYQLTKLLGRGGMGSVWLGCHASLGTQVAVKFIESEHATSAEARARFVNEAHAAARLKSKHVVQVFDHGVGDDGCPYIVMEFLSGEPLDARLDRQGVISPEEVVTIVHQVARGLQKAHELGIVHRDLKPENVFLVWDEEDQRDLVKVVDFGIAKFVDGASPTGSATRTGAVLGTPYYMSPEQARGLSSIDHRSDLWSLGVIVYRSLVGDLPFSGEAVGDLLVKICTIDPIVPSLVRPSLPPGFDAWLAKALAREPDQRFQSAREMALSLATALEVDSTFGPRTASFSLADVSSVSGGSVSGGSVSGGSVSGADHTAVAPRLRASAQTVASFSNTASERSAIGGRRGRWSLIAAAAVVTLGGAGLFAATRGTPSVQADPANEQVVPAAVESAAVEPAALEPAPAVEPLELDEPPVESAKPGTGAAPLNKPASGGRNVAAKPVVPSKPAATVSAGPAPTQVAAAPPTAAPAPTPTEKPAPTPKPPPKPAPTSTGRDLGY